MNKWMFIFLVVSFGAIAEELQLPIKQQMMFNEAQKFAKNISYNPNFTQCPQAIQNPSLPEPRNLKTEPRVLVFVSFSLGETAIQQYAREAKKTGASLVLRGLVNNSMKATLSRLQPIVQETQASFLIDPMAFRKFGIEKVPAVVVTTGNESSAFDVVYGLTTLGYALQSIAQKGEAASTAQKALKRLRGSS